ncbi:MAG: hypothetical protein JEZ12_28275 [Desulfobacterium sp.]|nr:hypothetical protein [Desulfobacterium sp.]
MPDNSEMEQLLAMLQQQGEQGAGDSLEQMLYQMILNPVRLTHQRISLSSDLADNVMFEIREGVIINENGYEEDMQELTINTNPLADGSPMNIYGVVKCQTCGSLIREESMARCARCLKVVCLAPQCAHYSNSANAFFCSRKCKWLSIFHL